MAVVGSIPDRRPVPGHYANPEVLGLPGIRRHRRSVRGQEKPPAIHHLTGLRPTEISMGHATFSMPATGWLASPPGFIPGGAIAFLVDGPLALAIESVLPAGRIARTSEISLNFVAPAFPGPGNLVARASVIDVGSQLGFSQAQVTDQHGRLVAHATSRCVVVDAPVIEIEGQMPVDPDWLGDGPDPWTEEPHGAVDHAVDDRPGIQVLREFIDGSRHPPPIGLLFGTSLVEVAEGETLWTATSSPWWSSPAPVLYGGALATLAEVAHSTAFWTLLEAGTFYATLDLKIQYLRPVFADGRPLTARGRVVHRGRSIMIGSVEVLNADDKVVLQGTGSAAVLPDGVSVLLAQRPE